MSAWLAIVPPLSPTSLPPAISFAFAIAASMPSLTNVNGSSPVQPSGVRSLCERTTIGLSSG